MKVRGTVVQGAWWAVRPVLCAATLSLLPLGCTSQHEAPQLSDTATNWLVSCAQPSDCSGEASCIAGVCTLACASAAAACDALHDARPPFSNTAKALLKRLCCAVFYRILGRLSAVPIPPDTLVVIDWGAQLDGYASDCTRTFATGELDPRDAEALSRQCGAVAAVPAAEAVLTANVLFEFDRGPYWDDTF